MGTGISIVWMTYQRKSKKWIVLPILLFFLAFFSFALFKPRFAVSDAYNILESAGFQNIHIYDQYQRMRIFDNENPFVPYGVVFECTIQDKTQVILFNFQNGKWTEVECSTR